MIFDVYVYQVSIHACKKEKYYIGIINLCIYLPEYYSCVLTCIQYRIRTWKTCVFTHVEHFRCNYSIYKEHAYVCIVYIYVHWHIGVWQDCHTSGPIVSRYKPAKDSIETFITTRCPESEFLRTIMGCSTLCWSRLVPTCIIAKFAHLNLFCGKY